MSTSDPTDHGPNTGGPGGAPRLVLRRFIRSMVILAVVIAGGGTLVVFAGRLPQGTGAGSLAIRALVGLTVGLIITVFVHRMMRALTQAPVGPPQRVDARPADVVYECGVCGTRVRLEVAATAKAPKHCGEEMEASVVSS